MALGYLLGKITAKVAKTSLNIPTILTLSIIPDADILFHGILQHRGPTHSIITALLIFLPFFVFYRKGAVPYFLAFVQHFLIGDYVGGGQLQLFWPLTTQPYGVLLEIESLPIVALETSFFLIAMFVMFKAHDFHVLFQPRLSNLVLAIPTFTVLLPTFLSFPLNVPLLLMPSHLVYMILFSASLILTTHGLLSKKLRRPSL